MKFLALCLISATTIAYSNGFAAEAELINMGIKFGVPFTEKAQGRIMATLWGSGRAARSSDVAIFNLAHKDFHLVHNACKWGGYSTDLFPESTIPVGKSSVFGIESSGFMTGVKCRTKYESDDGSWFEMLVDNPYFSANDVEARSSDDLYVLPTLGKGHNNRVRFVVKSRRL